MYEHLRNDFLFAMVENGISKDEIQHILLVLDQVASRYEVQPKELTLAVYNDDVPELVKNYVFDFSPEGFFRKAISTGGGIECGP